MNYARELIPLENLDSMHERYNIIENSGDGNCIFESVAAFHCYWGSIEESAKQIRLHVSEYYDSVLSHHSWPENSLQNLLIEMLVLESRNSSYTHQEKIRCDGIYGGICDLITAAFLFQFNFELYMKMSDGNYNLYSIRMQDTNTTHVFYYSGRDRYNALYEHIDQFEL
jgi:hypothetical protein